VDEYDVAGEDLPVGPADNARGRPVFRFQGLEIWKDALEVADLLFDVADRLEEKRLYRFAEQLRGSGLSMTNNIAEGSGSVSNREFHQYLNIARRSTFESANITLILERRQLISSEEATPLLQRLDRVCRKITNFQRTLRL
jgi:four helix bundle protein